MRWQARWVFKGYNTARLFAHCARPREHADQSTPWEMALACLEVGEQGKLISFLRTPDKWQINLRGVLAQAFSSVIIKLKIMTYNTFEWNKTDW